MRYSRLVVLLSMAVLVLASVASAQQAGEPTFETVWIPLTETPSPGSVTMWQTAVQDFLARIGLDSLRN